MRFFGIRLGGRGSGPAAAQLAASDWSASSSPSFPFGLGLLGILFDERRRGWQDRLAGVDVLYEEPQRRPPAPWSTLDSSEPRDRRWPGDGEGPGVPGPSAAAGFLGLAYTPLRGAPVVVTSGPSASL